MANKTVVTEASRRDRFDSFLNGDFASFPQISNQAVVPKINHKGTRDSQNETT
jgi:hypothetical protein